LGTLDGPAPLSRPSGKGQAILGAFVVLAALAHTAGIGALLDLRVHSDETIYLRHGAGLGALALPDASWSPLYCVWYAVLSALEPDGPRLYTLSYVALVTATTGLVYLLLLGLRAHALAAAAGSLAYLLSNAAVAHPHVGLFALLLILAGANVVVRARSEPAAYLAAGVTAALLPFARPEYVVSLGLFVAAGALALVVRRRRGRSAGDLRWAALFVAAVAVPFAAFGNPATGNKQWLSFCGSFLFAQPSYIPAPEPFVFPYNCVVVMPQVFGDADSLPEALVRNPGAVAGHVLANVRTWAALAAVLPFATPLPFLSARGQRAMALAELALVAAALAWAWRARRAGPAPPLMPRALVVFLAVLWPSSTLAALLYYPRPHYLVAQAAFLIVAAAAYVGAARGGAGSALRPGPALAFGLGLLVLTPNHVRGWLGAGRPLPGDAAGQEQVLARRFDAAFAWPRLLGQYWGGRPFVAPVAALEQYRPEAIGEDRATVALLRALGIAGPVTVVAVGDYSTYLAPGHRYVPWMRRKSQGVAELLEAQGADVLVVDRVLRGDYAYAEDWDAFLRDPARHGFARLEVPGTRRVVLVRRVRLPAAGA
jgi:hypothetical protein